ncbi:MAG: TolC family outer membrane protein [Sulfuricella denitrificans]|nr:TolC family outer membrane protein [Sulfuricella denitrificans]
MQVYLRAQANDPVFEAARHALDAGREKVPQAAAGLLPGIDLRASRSRARGEASFGEAPGAERKAFSNGWTLQLTQPLVRLQSWENYSQSLALERQAEAQFALNRQELILRVAQAYFDVLVAHESLGVAEAQQYAVEQQLGLARRTFEVGSATVTDVHESRSRFDLARAQRIAAANDLVIKRAELEKIVGDSIPLLAPLKPDAIVSGPEPGNAEAWISGARNGHLMVRIQQAALDAAEHEMSKSRAGHLPTLDLTVSREHNDASGSVSSPVDQASRVNSSQIGVQLTIPLFSGGATQARVREGEAVRRKAFADLEVARRQAAALARQAYSGVQSGLAQSEALAQAVISSRSAVEANRIGYKIGTRINIDVLNAEQQFYAAQRDLARTRYETVLQGLKLKAAAGTLDGTDVVAVNELLQTN